MHAVAVLDAVAMLGWLAAGIALLARWRGDRHGGAQWIFGGLTVFSFLYSACMFLEWTGITPKFEPVEDLLGVTLPVWWAFAIYAMVQHLLTADLREREADLQHAQRAACLGSWHYDLPRGDLRCTDEIYRLFGLNPQSRLTRAVLSAAVFAEDREKADAVWNAALRGEDRDAEYRIVVDEKIFWVRERVLPERNDRGELSAITGTIQDIDDRRRLEQEIRDAARRLAIHFHQTPLGVIEWDADYRIRDWNRAAEKMFGYDREEALGQHADLLMPRETREHEFELGRELLSADAGSRTTRHNRTKDGRVLLCEWYNTPLIADDGAVIGLASLVQDVTRRVQAEEDRNRLQEELHQSRKMEAIGQLAGGVAHDFNNLLTAILGNVEILNLLSPNQEEARNALDNIQLAVNRAVGLTRSLLTFSHRLPLAKKTVDLARVAGDAAKLLTRLLPAGIKLTVAAAADQDATVWGDETQLQQVILNLAINARDAMPQGGELKIAVKILSSADDLQDGFVLLTVADNGTGIPPEIRDRIFDPFFTTKQRGQGTGLGLSIVHGIVTESDGDILVDSQPGAGTTFTIRLPRLIAPQGETPTLVSQAVPRGAGELILLAEDDALVRDVIATRLRRYGYEVHPVVGGLELMHCYDRRRDRVRLLITDVDLPGLRGDDCVRDLRVRGEQVPAILISGMNYASQKWENDPGVLFLWKPFRLASLALAVADMLQRRPTRERV